MKKNVWFRLLAVCLCICMLPVFAVAETNDGTPVTRSDFSFRVNLHPEGFPDQSAAHLEDWQAFLGKLSIEGVADVQSFLSPYSRVYFDGGLCLNGENKLPFVYDGYYSYRYLRSPAIRNEHLHFQMFNFFQFMLKPYYYMGLPTHLLALVMYPEAAMELLTVYWIYTDWTTYGEGDRVVSSDYLKQLVEYFQFYGGNDFNDRLYYFFTCLLMDTGLTDVVLERLNTVDVWLDYLDPDQQGLIIDVEGENESWMLGETEVFRKEGSTCTLTLPDDIGYVYSFTRTREGGDLDAQFVLSMEEEELLNVTLDIDGLLSEGVLSTSGHAELTVSGSELYVEYAPLAFDFQVTRSSEAMPCSFTLNADWLHPDTGLPAMGYTYEAELQELPPDVLFDLEYDHQDDFFHLNESFLNEYKERYLPTIALSMVPFLLEMPAGVISDTVAFLEETGILAVLGIE